MRPDIFPELQDRGMSAVARFCHLVGINFAGFDLMFPDDGPPVFIEINFNFGRKGLGGTPGFRKLFKQAVELWQQGVAYPLIQEFRDSGIRQFKNSSIPHSLNT
jgi:hypothetical protein